MWLSGRTGPSQSQRFRLTAMERRPDTSHQVCPAGRFTFLTLVRELHRAVRCSMRASASCRIGSGEAADQEMHSAAMCGSVSISVRLRYEARHRSAPRCGRASEVVNQAFEVL